MLCMSRKIFLLLDHLVDQDTSLYNLLLFDSPPIYIALDTTMRMEGLPSLTLWDPITEVVCNQTKDSTRKIKEKVLQVDDNLEFMYKKQMSLQSFVDSIDYAPSFFTGVQWHLSVLCIRR